MNRGLQDIDELFRASLGDYEDKPSEGVKKNLDTALDKIAATDYKKRFIIWKRISLLLLLLLAGFILFDTALFKTGGQKHTTKDTGVDAEKTSSDKTAITSHVKNKPATGNNMNSIQPPDLGNNLLNRQTPGGVNIAPDISFTTTNENIFQKSNSLVPDLLPQPYKNVNGLAIDETGFELPKHEISLLSNVMNSRPAIDRLEKRISLLTTPSGSQAVLPLPNTNNSDEKKSKRFAPHWLLSPFVSYEQAGYRLDSDDPLAVTNIKHNEVHEPSFSGGLLIARQFSNRFSLQTGLVYTSTQIGTSPQKMYALQLPGGDIAYKFISSSGYAYIKLKTGQQPAVGDSITTSDSKHLLKHISVPLIAKYKLGKGRLNVSPSAGVEANFITSAKVEVGVDFASNREIVSVNKLNGIKTFYWSGITGVEASYNVNKKLSLNIQPVFRFALSPITNENVVETFPRSFGVRAGATIKF